MKKKFAETVDIFMHKQYRKLDKVGNSFMVLGGIIFFVLFAVGIFEKVCPEKFVSGLMAGPILGLFYMFLFSVLYGVLIDFYCLSKGDSFITGLCACSAKDSKSFVNFCVSSKKLCSNCNVSLITESVIPFTNGGSNLDVKFGYEIGLVNEKEIKPFFRRFLSPNN